ncbi:dihydrofolate reductase family protein [Actinoplanes sp. N902-109]|uniref:dihydrofolate reductase family protein n=1 Tax=Actinoplanes sp. (strain N902-109) TaxID=649831 RepID=UPI0003295536|nr:dihydrofolate reductase family protein [Actinoplanes sp. N902-109]AGL15561.1 bifunctional deaminase-reductase domain protein [Actinoplanes sp. N902-109]
MGKLICTGITSLDGYIEDESGSFAWSEPDDEVHAFANELERGAGLHLYGRRLYDVMTFWEDFHDGPAVQREYAELWRATDKVVFSTTLTEVRSARTRVERTFDPEAVRAWKQDRDLDIGGPELAAHAFRAGLVDEVQLLVNPVIVGGGKPFLPVGWRTGLTLLAERRFTSGVVHLRYQVG